MRLLLIAFAALLLAAGSAGAATELGSATAKLTLDGGALRPELALTPGARSLGLMNRRRAPADGMLFVFPGADEGRLLDEGHARSA